MVTTVALVNMLLRTLIMLITSRRKPHTDFREVGRVAMRVTPNDLDLLGHVNNGVYLSLMDLGRMDLMIQSGKWQQLGNLGWYPVAAAVSVTYRRSLRLWQRYVLETKVLGFDDKAMYVEQRFVRDDEVYVDGIVRARFLKKTGGVVTVAELGELAGVDPTTMPIPTWIAAWARDSALPPAKATFPSDWV
jgi:acyl-CoA thioesterase FadM